MEPTLPRIIKYWLFGLAAVIVVSDLGIAYVLHLGSNDIAAIDAKIQNYSAQVEALRAGLIEQTLGSTTPIQGGTNARPSYLENPVIQALEPKSGERYCLGKNMLIRWQAPKDMQTVTVYLIPGGLNGYAIGSYPASYNETGAQDGRGEVSWTIPNRLSLVGEAYTLRVNGIYNSTWTVSNPVGPFGIENCQG